jgi:hypothetical protein
VTLITLVKGTTSKLTRGNALESLVSHCLLHILDGFKLALDKIVEVLFIKNVLK